MRASWMLYSIAISLLLGIAAVVAERAFHLWTLPGRWIWTSALLGSLLLALLAWFAPAPRAAPALDRLDRVVMNARVPQAIATRTVPPTRQTNASEPRTELVNRGLLVLWLALSGGVVVVLAMSGHRIRVERQRLQRALVDGTPVLLSDRLGPAVVGFSRPEIVLPRWALEADADVRRLIISHEREHLRARDQVLIALSLFIMALVPWNVVFWWHIRRLRHAIEVDCDTRVLRNGEDVKLYGALLLEVSRRPRLQMPLATTLAEPASYLERRIRIMTSQRPKHGWLLGGISAVTSACLLLVACETPRPTSVAEGGEPQMSTNADPSKQFQGLQIWDVSSALVKQQYPAIHADGLPVEKAIWVAVDQHGDFKKTWIGPADVIGTDPNAEISVNHPNAQRIGADRERLTQDYLRQVAPGMDIRATFHSGVYKDPSRRNAHVRVIWAVEDPKQFYKQSTLQSLGL